MSWRVIVIEGGGTNGNRSLLLYPSTVMVTAEKTFPNPQKPYWLALEAAETFT